MYWGGGGRDGKQVVFNQSGRETGSQQGPFGGVMKVVSMPSGSRAPPFLFPMAEGRGRGGNCAGLWVRGVANEAPPAQAPLD